MAVEVLDNPQESRYEVLVDGALAGLSQYRLLHDRITIFHTEIDPAFEGRGLGGELARTALDDIRERGLELIPMCPFIAAYVHDHQEQYLELVPPQLRARVMAHG